MEPDLNTGYSVQFRGCRNRRMDASNGRTRATSYPRPPRRSCGSMHDLDEEEEVEPSKKVYRIKTSNHHDSLAVQDADPWAIWVGFKESTSAHGIPHFNKAPGQFKRAFWLIISLACLTGFIYNLASLSVLYNEYKVDVVVELKHRREMIFPAVTICNTNPIKSSKLYLSRELSAFVENSQRKKRSVAEDAERKKRSVPEDSERKKRSVAEELERNKRLEKRVETKQPMAEDSERKIRSVTDNSEREKLPPNQYKKFEEKGKTLDIVVNTNNSSATVNTVQNNHDNTAEEDNMKLRIFDKLDRTSKPAKNLKPDGDADKNNAEEVVTVDHKAKQDTVLAPDVFVLLDSHQKRFRRSGEDTKKGLYNMYTKSIRYANARVVCQTQGMALLAVKSPADHESLRGNYFCYASLRNEGLIKRQLSNGVSWLGLTDPEGDNTWGWADGEPMTYSRWMASQPDSLDRERCARIINTNGDWANTRCSKTYPVICEGGVDHCAESPCVGGVCCNVNNDWYCACYSGYSGKQCEIGPTTLPPVPSTTTTTATTPVPSTTTSTTEATTPATTPAPTTPAPTTPTPTTPATTSAPTTPTPPPVPATPYTPEITTTTMSSTTTETTKATTTPAPAPATTPTTTPATTPAPPPVPATPYTPEITTTTTNDDTSSSSTTTTTTATSQSDDDTTTVTKTPPTEETTESEETIPEEATRSSSPPEKTTTSSPVRTTSVQDSTLDIETSRTTTPDQTTSVSDIPSENTISSQLTPSTTAPAPAQTATSPSQNSDLVSSHSITLIEPTPSRSADFVATGTYTTQSKNIVQSTVEPVTSTVEPVTSSKVPVTSPEVPVTSSSALQPSHSAAISGSSLSASPTYGLSKEATVSTLSSTPTQSLQDTSPMPSSSDYDTITPSAVLGSSTIKAHPTSDGFFTTHTASVDHVGASVLPKDHYPSYSQGQVDRPLREDFVQEEQVLEILANTDAGVKREMGYTWNETILDCQYEGYNCLERDFSYFFDAIHGNCYVFNAGWGRTNDDQLFRSHKAGRRYGLKVLLNIGQYEYVDKIGETAGTVVVVHPQDKMPFPEDEGVLGVPGQMTAIGIRQIEVQRLSGNYGNCTDIHIRNFTRNVFEEKYGVSYSTNACFKTCYQRYVIELCGCADANYPMEGQAFGFNHSSCNVLNAKQVDCKLKVMEMYMADELTCNCPNPCYDVLYTYQTSAVKWPSQVQQDAVYEKFASKIPQLRNDPDALNQNLLRVDVYFEEFNYEKIKEAIHYPLANYISDLGGMIGLWVGCSILSIFEFIELGLDCLVWFLLHLAQKGQAQKPTKLQNNRSGEHEMQELSKHAQPSPSQPFMISPAELPPSSTPIHGTDNRGMVCPPSPPETEKRTSSESLANGPFKYV